MTVKLHVGGHRITSRHENLHDSTNESKLENAATGNNLPARADGMLHRAASQEKVANQGWPTRLARLLFLPLQLAPMGLMT
mmetsp:Transcript_73893/g.130552  ORF Transcript_73893/g.130552 Transcript_73893/m.130552 type:complete len:81 (+) Transcript_73893:143-385(+)